MQKLVRHWGFVANAVLICFGIEASAVAQDWQEKHKAAFEAFEASSTLEDLIRQAANAPYNDSMVREALFYQAAYESLRPGFYFDIDHQRFTLRLATFAVLLSLAAENRLDAWPQGEDLYSLGEASSKSLDQNTGFGSDEEAFRRLIRRRPAVEVPPGDGFFRYLIFRNLLDGTYVVLERADVKWRDLGPAWSIEQGKIETPKGPFLPVEGRAFLFPLMALPDLAFAGKSYFLIDLLGRERSAFEKYLLILAGNSFYSLGAGDGSYESPSVSRLGEFPFQKALRAFIENGPEGALINASVIQDRLTTIRFFSGRYRTALGDYRRVAADSSESPWSRAAAQWGAMICLLGLEDGGVEDALREFDHRLIQLKSGEADSGRYKRYAYSLRALLDALGRPLTAAAGGDEVLTGTDRSTANFDLFRIFHSLDRPDLSVRLSIRELKRARHLQPADAAAVARERLYLRELGASLNDLFSHLSWRRVEWAYEPVEADAHLWERDFAPVLLDRIRGGCRGTRRYGACSPEEDLAVAGELYSTPNDDYNAREINRLMVGTSATLGVPPEYSPPPSAEEFRSWVEAEIATAPVNYEPFLKLIGLEWFIFPMASLQDYSVDFETWRYRPLKESGITEPDAADARLRQAGEALSPRSRQVWSAYLEARRFLDQEYGGSPRQGH